MATSALPVDCPSARTVDRNADRGTNLSHAVAAQRSKAIDEHTGRHALDRVQVDGATAGDRVLARFEDDLARYPADRGRAGSHEGPSEPRDRHVPGEHEYRSAPDVGKLTPPKLPSPGRACHERPAASRNEARSPHSSGPSIGWVSYAP